MKHTRIAAAWRAQCYLFRLIRTALDDLDPPHERAARLVGQLTRVRVRHPAVDTTAARVDPEQVTIPKVLAKRRIEHLDCNRDKLPAAAADALVRAARANLVVVGHIDIKDNFARNWAESGFLQRLSVLWLGRLALATAARLSLIHI